MTSMQTNNSSLLHVQYNCGTDIKAYGMKARVESNAHKHKLLHKQKKYSKP